MGRFSEMVGTKMARVSHKTPYLHRNVLQAEIDLYRSQGIHVYELPAKFFRSLKFMGKFWYKTAGIYISRIQESIGPDMMFIEFDNDNALYSFGVVDRSIIIRKNLPNYYKFLVLLHEKGHDICFESQCRCINKPVLCEIHAWRHEFSTLLQRELWDLLKSAIEGFNKKDAYAYDPVRRAAMKTIKRSALWRKCVSAVHQSPSYS